MTKEPKEPKGGYIPSRGMFIAKSTLRCLQILFGILALALTGSISFGTKIGEVMPFIVVSPCVSLSSCPYPTVSRLPRLMLDTPKSRGSLWLTDQTVLYLLGPFSPHPGHCRVARHQSAGTPPRISATSSDRHRFDLLVDAYRMQRRPRGPRHDGRLARRDQIQLGVELPPGSTSALGTRRSTGYRVQGGSGGVFRQCCNVSSVSSSQSFSHDGS